jgi:hypothetical protein
VGEYSACDVAVFGAELILGETSHVHDECIVGTSRVIINSSPILKLLVGRYYVTANLT